MTAWESLLELMDRLRGPDGCPWDREQTMKDLKTYLIEEAHEVLEAIDESDPEALREELGDLLFQIVFLSRIGKERGEFDADAVVRGITEKMKRRHPHVFGDAKAGTSTEVLRQWEEIKKEERSSKPDASALDGVPRSLPSLLRAQRLTTKAARIGFDWPGPAPVLDKIDEELRELRQAVDAGDEKGSAEELGDLLFSAANLARHLGFDPEECLQETNQRFTRRFRSVEKRLHERRDGDRASLDEMNRLWEEAKRAERSGRDQKTEPGGTVEPEDAPPPESPGR